MGLNAGYGFGDSSQRDSRITPPAPPPLPIPGDGDYHVRGGSVGITAGYGSLINKWLLGIEGDINWADISGSSSVCGTNHTCGARLEGYGTLRGRIGTYMGSTLVYATGGLAYGEITAFDRLNPAFEATKRRAGWTVGGGLETPLTDKLSMKLEYLYMDFRRGEYFTIPGFTAERVDLDVHTVRIGLNYSLGDPAPRAAPLK